MHVSRGFYTRLYDLKLEHWSHSAPTKTSTLSTSELRIELHMTSIHVSSFILSPKAAIEPVHMGSTLTNFLFSRTFAFLKQCLGWTNWKATYTTFRLHQASSSREYHRHSLLQHCFELRESVRIFLTFFKVENNSLELTRIFKESFKDQRRAWEKSVRAEKRLMMALTPKRLFLSLCISISHLTLQYLLQ